MRFGMAMSLMHETVEQARQAEAYGFDYLSTGEHINFPVAASNTIVSLAAAAGATERIRLVSSITLVPLYPPALLAKQVAMLDVVSGGRFELGVGIGGEFPAEFDAVGVPVRERGRRTDEALEIIDLLLREKNVSFDGRYTSLEDITISPSPIQKPRVPIWVAGRKDAAMRRVAQFGEVWLPYMYTPDMLRESVDKIAGFCNEAGRSTDAVDTALYIFTCVHEDRDTALELANEQLSRQYAQDFSKLVHKYTIAGSPEDCIEQIQMWRDAGANTIIFGSGCPQHHVDENVRLIAEELLPAFH
ncbi:MAG: LLM class flavin-dependent oxidoreductase [Actinomycetota bacterium]